MAIIIHTSEILMLIVAIIGITRYSMLNNPFKILTLSAIASLVIDILSDIFNARYKNNAPVLHLEAITEFVFYALVYYYLFDSQGQKK
ncbi:MAG: hypothetical protein NVSMB24_16100 [Mucilaginibacter sp.]